MHRPALILLLLAAAAGAEESLGSRVNRALDRAAENLVTRQEADGSWYATDAVHPLGRTALCTYALLHAGVARDHQAVTKAVAFLRVRRFETRSTYETGCLLLLLHALGPGHDREIHRLCRWLVARFDRGARLWGYPDGAPDLSNTQFAIFGLKVGEMHGFKVPRDLWKDVAKGVVRLQHESGAFRYKPDAIYRASMTHAALLVLHFAGEAARPSRDAARAAKRGRDWCEKNFRVDVTPWGRGHHHGYYYYYMYGLARYAQVHGLKTIAGRDWYREGAAELLDRQEANGSWGNLEDTCFAILFLRKVVFTAPRARGKEAPGGAAAPKKDARPRPGPQLPCQREWLLAGPFASGAHEDDMLYTEHFPVKRASPRAGGRAGKRKWLRYASPEDEIDLAAACGPGDFSTFYAALWLHAEAAGEAVLWLGSDDGHRVYLNGIQVHEGHHHDYSGDDFYRIPLPLAAGRNLLLVKVENHGYYCHFKARLEAEGVAAGVKR